MSKSKDDFDIVRIVPVDITYKLDTFNQLLESIGSIDDKKRKLWEEIYSNAIVDRQNAYVIFARLSDICESKSTEHAVHGRTLTSCIERMSKANEQLIKLAELIAKSVEESESIDIGNMYAKIEGAH
jgi:hypothetical protein